MLTAIEIKIYLAPEHLHISKVILYYSNDRRTCLHTRSTSCHAGQHNKYRHAGQV